MKERIRIGLYGCNPYRTKQLMDAALKIMPGRITVEACYDIDHDKADQTAAAYASKPFYELTAFLKTGFDVAIICLPPYLHPDAFAVCAESGKDVYLEKPVCVDDRGRDKLIKAMLRYSPKCYVGFSYPYFMPFRKVLDIRRQAETGAFISVHHHRFAPGSGVMPVNPNWRHRFEESGGELNHHCSHDMHYLRLVGGEPESVTAMEYTTPGYQPAHEEEELSACFRFKRGIGLFSLSQRSHRAHLTGHIHMEHCSLLYDWAPHSTLKVFRNRPRAAEDTYEWDAYGEIPLEENSSILQMKDFLDAYSGDKPMPITLSDGIKAYEMTKAIRKSYREKREVAIPDCGV